MCKNTTYKMHRIVLRRGEIRKSKGVVMDKIKVHFYACMEISQ
jgi:hypothetical protein